MANNRLTWNPLQGPDFRDALLGTRIAGDMFGEGFQGLGNVAQAIRQRQDEEITARALSEASKITDVGGWDAAVSQLGLGAFAADPTRLTAAGMAELNDRRSGIINQNANRDLNNRANASHAQNMLEQQHSWNLRMQGEERAQHARDWLDQNSRGENGVYSVEDLQFRLEGSDLDPQLRDEILRQAGSLPGTRFAATEESQRAALSGDNNPLATTSIGIESSLRELDLAKQANNGLGFYLASTTAPNDGRDWGANLIQTLTAREDGAPNDQNFMNSVGKVRDAFEDLKQKFAGTGVTDQMIAKALETNLDNGWWIAGNYQNQKLAVDRAEALLRQFDTVEKRAGFDRSARDYRTQEAKLSQFSSRMNKLLNKAAQQIDDGNTAGYQKTMESARTLEAEYGKWSQGNRAPQGATQDVPSPTPPTTGGAGADTLPPEQTPAQPASEPELLTILRGRGNQEELVRRSNAARQHWNTVIPQIQQTPNQPVTNALGDLSNASIEDYLRRFMEARQGGPR